MDDKVDLILKRLISIDNTLNQQGDMLTQLISIVAATNQKIDGIQSGQIRQDKILESLALRSLEQETEIRDIKRVK